MPEKLPTLAALVVVVAALGWVLDRFFTGSSTTVTRDIHRDVKEAVAASEEGDN